MVFDASTNGNNGWLCTVILHLTHLQEINSQLNTPLLTRIKTVLVI